MTQPFMISSGISSNVGQVLNDAYLIIISGKDKNDYSVQEFDTAQNQTSQSLFQQTVSTGIIGNLGMAIWTSPIAQGFASKALPNAVLGRLNSSIYDIMSDGKVSIAEVGETLIDNCTNVLDSVALDLGFPTVTGLYNAIMPNGSGVIAQDFIQSLSKVFDKNNKQQVNIKDSTSDDVIILKLKLVTEDNEDLGINIPTRKTEKNFNIPVAISNENIVRTFTVEIVSKENINMYDIKDKLTQIRSESQHIDVYVNDKDVLKNEIIKNCLLSNLSFDVRDQNCLTCSLSITQVPQWEVNLAPYLRQTVKSGQNKSKGKSGVKNNPKTNPQTTVKPQSISEIVSSSGYKNTWNECANTYRQAKKNIELHPDVKQYYDYPKQNSIDTMYNNLNPDLDKGKIRVTKTQIEQAFNTGLTF